MPFLWYFPVVGSALLGLLFFADAMLPARGPLGLSTEFHGISATLQSESTGSIRTPVEPDLPGVAPAPDMKSPAIRLAREGAPKLAVAPNLEPVNQPAVRAEPALTLPKKRKQVARTREPRQPAAHAREWRDQYAQANDFGWNWGSNNRSGPQHGAWRNESWRGEWRNEFWRDDRGWR
jgi:hypothetical protein